MSVRLRKVPNPPGHNRGLGSQRSCVLHTRDVRSAQPLAERMTLQPVVTRDDPTYKTGKHATRSVYIHTCACAALHGTLTPVLHLTTSHPPQFALPRRSCRGGARSATIPGCWSPLSECQIARNAVVPPCKNRHGDGPCLSGLHPQARRYETSLFHGGRLSRGEDRRPTFWRGDDPRCSL